MINTSEFSKRLQNVIDYYDETASGFAEKIGVQRSSISHVLSGRNKPSLDFVMKVLQAYPEVELYWLLNGKGEFPKKQSSSALSSAADSGEDLNMGQDTIESENNSIEKIVIFYKDGTFKSYDP
jgi:transcriptional regulator with XRE-family HTH domain